MTLDHLPLGRNARITAIAWHQLVTEEALRLQALGVEVGASVTIMHRGVLWSRDPLALAIGRMTVAVRRAHARAIEVEPQ